MALLEEVSRKLEQLSPSDYSVLLHESEELRVKFYNNKLAAAERASDKWLQVYVAKSKRRALGSTSSLSPQSLDDLVRFLGSSLKVARESAYSPLPPPGRYAHNGDVDEKTLSYDASKIVGVAVNEALASGAKRVAGALRMGLLRTRIKTSSGVQEEDLRSYAALNVRAFVDSESSGQGISVSTSPSRLDPRLAGRQAGEYASLATRKCQVSEGRYRVLLSPAVFADLVQHVGWASSAYSVLSGFSFLEGRLGEQVASEQLTIADHGQIMDGVNSRMFDDEGAPTKSKRIISNGRLGTFLHNTSTAAEMGSETTGNAGLIEPRPWNLEVMPGDSSPEEMVKDLRHGLIITSNWYTRFQNFRTGDYSTLPRDATLLVENGDVKCSLRGLRISSNMLRDLGNVEMISRDRVWVKWWEVETPVLAPYVLLREMDVTKPW